MPSIEEKEQELATLLNWFKERGGILNDKVTIRYQKEDGYSGVAVDDLEAGTILVECPLELSLSHLNLYQGMPVPFVKSDVQKCIGMLPEEQLTRLLLIEQLVLGEESRWAPYIGCLPDPNEMKTALWYDSPYFSDTALGEARKNRLAAVKGEWEHIRKVLEEVGLKDSPLHQECDL